MIIRREVASAALEARSARTTGSVTLTIGVASFPGDANTAAELIETANGRRYEGKPAATGWSTRGWWPSS